MQVAYESYEWCGTVYFYPVVQNESSLWHFTESPQQQWNCEADICDSDVYEVQDYSLEGDCSFESLSSVQSSDEKDQSAGFPSDPTTDERMLTFLS
jgi:hypothetical protein